MPNLEARNGIWTDSRSNPVFLGDAQAVEFCVTTWRQAAKDGTLDAHNRTERLAFLLKLQYCDGGTVTQKCEDYGRRFHSKLIERTYFRALDKAEQSIEVLLPDPVGEITVALRTLENTQ